MPKIQEEVVAPDIDDELREIINILTPHVDKSRVQAIIDVMNQHCEGTVGEMICALCHAMLFFNSYPDTDKGKPQIDIRGN